MRLHLSRYLIFFFVLGLPLLPVPSILPVKHNVQNPVFSSRVSNIQVVLSELISFRAFNAIFGKVGRAASAEVMIQLFNSKCLPILYYGIDVCPLTNTQINSLQFVINSCYGKIFMIKSNDDIRYCQDVFGCLPVADIVKWRTAIFLKKYKEANDK